MTEFSLEPHDIIHGFKIGPEYRILVDEDQIKQGWFFSFGFFLFTLNIVKFYITDIDE